MAVILRRVEKLSFLLAGFFQLRRDWDVSLRARPVLGKWEALELANSKIIFFILPIACGDFVIA